MRLGLCAAGKLWDWWIRATNPWTITVIPQSRCEVHHYDRRSERYFRLLHDKRLPGRRAFSDEIMCMYKPMPRPTTQTVIRLRFWYNMIWSSWTSQLGVQTWTHWACLGQIGENVVFYGLSLGRDILDIFVIINDLFITRTLKALLRDILLEVVMFIPDARTLWSGQIIPMPPVTFAKPDPHVENSTAWNWL